MYYMGNRNRVIPIYILLLLYCYKIPQTVGFKQLQCSKYWVADCGKKDPLLYTENGTNVALNLVDLVVKQSSFNEPKNIPEKQTTTRNRFSSLKDLKYYNYFAHAAECPFTVANYTSVPVKTCGPYPPVLRDTTRCEWISNCTADSFVLLLWSEDRDEVIVAFRGTRSTDNLRTDLETSAFRSKKVQGAAIHGGFFKAAESIYVKTAERIKYMVKKYNPAKLTFTGHSLGGALATLLLSMLKVYGDMPTNVKLKLVTYGMPRTGNIAAADFINNLGIETTRVVANNDIIPHVPPVSAVLGDEHYVHFRNEVWINKNQTLFCRANTYEDKECSNSVSPAYNHLDHLKYWDVRYGDWLLPKDVGNLTKSLLEDVGLKNLPRRIWGK